jgi:hypothetical protein
MTDHAAALRHLLDQYTAETSSAMPGNETLTDDERRLVARIRPHLEALIAQHDYLLDALLQGRDSGDRILSHYRQQWGEPACGTEPSGLIRKLGFTEPCTLAPGHDGDCRHRRPQTPTAPAHADGATE